MEFGNEGVDRTDASEADHRIANHLAMLAGYVRLKMSEVSTGAEAPDRACVLRLVEGIGAQMAAVADLHRMLSTGACLSSSNIGVQIGRICAAFREGPACGATISYSSGPGCLLPLRQILPVLQIVSEVMTNALKHGHKADMATAIRVSCRKDSRDRIVIAIRDAGEGIAPQAGAGPPSGIGRRLVENLARQVGGTIRYRSSATGLDFRLSLPALVRPTADPRPAGPGGGPLRGANLQSSPGP
ncbi:sensor histidine kinase [Cereibacter azotoformans]|uniref:histidine kinase n=1 Tax=Cereibacter sphaeroides (strain ATCC 17025 / ATH 2.4.3) TaxID=349102 RepID=A4WY99_CERS5|nr:sensor histidine kinase [Cereibacter azotoformans]ULB11799.1 sensor histidine kinase [Cereibacter azotoformans]